jgi:hypothetical protein
MSLRLKYSDWGTAQRSPLGGVNANSTNSPVPSKKINATPIAQKRTSPRSKAVVSASPSFEKKKKKKKKKNFGFFF